jgi:hypothetical protein
MPSVSGPPYSTTPMLAAYAGEEVAGNSVWGTAVQYLSATERASYALTVKDGRIEDVDGNPFDTQDAESLHSASGRAIFVLDAGGNLYAEKDHVMGQFHHSSFLAGGPVAAAGELEVRNGTLTLLSDKSGHYRPQRSYTDQAIDRLAQNGVDFQQVTLDLVGGP